MKLRIGVWRGEGIGPEIVNTAINVTDAVCEGVGVTVDWVEVALGSAAIQQFGEPVPESTIATLTECDAWVIGPHDSSSYPAPWNVSRNPSGELRHRFALFANIRPSRSLVLGGVPPRMPPINLVLVRENTEGFYADRNMFSGNGEVMPVPGVALTTGVFTREAVERVAHVACEIAARRSGRLAIGHKANVLPLSMGLFRDTCLAVANMFPSLDVTDYHFDALAGALIRAPEEFDVIVTENMFGDVLSSVTAELAGSIGSAGSLNVGQSRIMAQASHGSAPEIAGRNVANPVGIVSSVSMLFEWLGRTKGQQECDAVSKRIMSALDEALLQGIYTEDMGGTTGTREFGESVTRFAVLQQ